ncbi:MAG: hypothetical protein WBI07_13395 [Mobilitalea sp.]
MNENNLEKMLVKLKKINKDKNEQLQKHNNRKLRIVEKKRPVEKKIENDKYDRL